MKKQTVLLHTGVQNREFQLLTKFKDTLGKQSHLLVAVFYTKEQE